MMIFQGLGADQDVVDVISCQLAHVQENIVHGLLKCCSGVVQSERHNLLRESTVLGTERCAFDVFWKYPNLMKALVKIELGEVPCISNSVKHLINSW